MNGARGAQALGAMRTKLNPVPSFDAGERPIKRIVARHAFDRDGDVLVHVH
jgi:hypothetical protein